jgi:hypothetical protein
MSTPALVPQQKSEVTPEPQTESPSKWWALLVLCWVAAVGFALGSTVWNSRSDESPGPQAQAAIDRVDQTIQWIAAAEWELAYEAFDGSCSNFGLSEFRAGFEPVFASYRSHALTPPDSEPFEIGQIVLVRGVIDLGGGSDNALRAELRLAESPSEAVPMWRLCGLRIDES